MNLVEWNYPDQDISKIVAFKKLLSSKVHPIDKEKISLKHQILYRRTAIVVLEERRPIPLVKVPPFPASFPGIGTIYV